MVKRKLDKICIEMIPSINKMQPSYPIKHTKSSLTEEMRMMNQKFPQRRPQPNPYFQKNNNNRPTGFPVHNTFTSQRMNPSQPRPNPMNNPLQRSTNYRSFQNKHNLNLNGVNRNNPRSMAALRSPNQLGGSRSFAPGLPMGSPSINHSNVISVRFVMI